MGIPKNRPVIGKDLDDIKQAFGLKTGDICWLLGASATKWTELVRKNPEKPVEAPALALLVRWLDAFPDTEVIPKSPTPEELFSLINEVVEMDKKTFSVMSGAEESACSRWIRLGVEPSTATQRLFYFLGQRLAGKTRDNKIKIIKQWLEIVRAEGVSRTDKDPFVKGSWKNKKKKKEKTEDPA